MVKSYKIDVDPSTGDVLNTARKFLGDLLKTDEIDALLVPQELSSGKNVVQTLVNDPNKLEKANPFAFVMPINSARLISKLTDQNPGKKLGLVIRNCELRAMNELIKLQQINNENLVVIGVDCFGTFSLPDYAKLSFEEENITLELLKNIKDNKGTGDGVGIDNYQIRDTCAICQHPIPSTSDITIGVLGTDINKELLIQGNSEKGEEILEKLSLTETEVPPSRAMAIEAYIKGNTERREEVVKEILAEIDSMPKLLSALATCIKCYNCREACPICYCKECIFDTSAFNPSPNQFINKAEKKGIIKMPMDMLLYHITRMNHMITSCVGCGQCESACPNEIPVAKIFTALGDKIQDIFDYVPGCDLKEELPLATFKEDELEPKQ
jgi:formate dehydrogenase subunit beta